MTTEFAQIIGPLAQLLLGEPNRAMSSAVELRYGAHGSLSVDLAKGTWFDHEANEGGGVLDLVTRETKLRAVMAVQSKTGGIRVNKAGCLDRCAGGPVAVVYPDETWYTYVDKSDIDEIVDSHLVGGKPVDRLILPADVGR